MPIVKINQDTFVDRGLLDNVDVIVKDAAFTIFDYGGKAVPQTALKLDLALASNPDNIHEQYWSVGGGTERFIPTPDGKQITTTSDEENADANLTAKSNLHYLYLSLVDNGVPKDILDGANGCKALIGLAGHVDSKPIKRAMQDGDKENKVLVFTSISALPGDKARTAVAGRRTGGPSAAGTPTTTTASAPAGTSTQAIASSDEQVAELGNLLLEAVSAGPLAVGPIKAKCLNPSTGLKLTPAKERAKFIDSRLSDPEFLEQYGLVRNNTTPPTISVAG